MMKLALPALAARPGGARSSAGELAAPPACGPSGGELAVRPLFVNRQVRGLTVPARVSSLVVRPRVGGTLTARAQP